MISVICCYNNKKVLDDFLLHSINRCFDSSVEVIVVDNRENQFTSISKAYNYSLSKAKGEWLMFCHQDIAFEPELLGKINTYLEEKNQYELCIYGFAGIKSDGKVYSNIQRRDSKKYIISNRVTDVIDVESLDECCFIISRNAINILGGFDEKVCNNWHMYCVELCLRCIKRQGYVRCLPEIVYHKDGSTNTSVLLDPNFLKTVYKVAKMYKNSFSSIYAPCYIVKTKFPYLEIRILKSYIKYYLKK